MKTVSRMSAENLRELIEDVVERELLEIVADPDRGLALRPEVRKRLLASLEAQRKGKKGTPASQVVRKLGLEW